MYIWLYYRKDRQNTDKLLLLLSSVLLFFLLFHGVAFFCLDNNNKKLFGIHYLFIMVGNGHGTGKFVLHRTNMLIRIVLWPAYIAISMPTIWRINYLVRYARCWWRLLYFTQWRSCRQEFRGFNTWLSFHVTFFAFDSVPIFTLNHLR